MEQEVQGTPAAPVEQQAAPAETQAASVGKPRVVTNPILEDADETRTNGAPAEAPEESPAEVPAQNPAEAPAQNPAPAETPVATGVTEDQVREFLKTQGIEVTDFSSLKDKITANEPAPAEPTPAELTRQEAEEYTRMLAVHTKEGGDVDSFNEIRKITKLPDEQVALAVIKETLTEQGFNEAQVENIIAEQYTQVAEEDIDAIEDEAEREFARKKNAYIQQQFIAQGQAAKNKAQEYLDTLGKEIKSSDSLVAAERQVSSKVDEVLSTIPRSMTLELGQSDGQDIDPIPFNVSDEVISEVKGILTDPVQRNKFFYNEDGTMNIESIAKVLVENRSLRAMNKVAYLEGGTREVKKVQTVFPLNDPNAVGVGGDTSSTNNGSAKAASVGKAYVVNPTPRK